MLKLIDRICIVLLALGSIGHLIGTLTLFEFGTQVFVWSLSGVLAAVLVVSLNVLRHRRTLDKPIAAISLISGLSWIFIVFMFGQSIGNVFDPRVLMHALSTIGLCYFSAKNLFSMS